MEGTSEIKDCDHPIFYLEVNSNGKDERAYCFRCKSGPLGFVPSKDLRVGARYNGMELYWSRNGNENGNGHSHSMLSATVTQMRRHRDYRDVEPDDETLL